nr:hypothetical protein [uncultured Brevundimonas sp.]
MKVTFLATFPVCVSDSASGSPFADDGKIGRDDVNRRCGKDGFAYCEKKTPVMMAADHLSRHGPGACRDNSGALKLRARAG